MFGEGDDEQTCLLGEDWELWFQPQFHERMTLLVFTSGILSIINFNGAISSSRILSQLQNAQTLVFIETNVNIQSPTLFHLFDQNQPCRHGKQPPVEHQNYYSQSSFQKVRGNSGDLQLILFLRSSCRKGQQQPDRIRVAPERRPFWDGRQLPEPESTH